MHEALGADVILPCWKPSYCHLSETPLPRYFYALVIWTLNNYSHAVGQYSWYRPYDTYLHNVVSVIKKQPNTSETLEKTLTLFWLD